MISVLTGTPGNGKTAHAVDMCWFDKSSMWYSLEKYVDGVAGLKCEHYEFPDIKELKAPGYVSLSQVDNEKYAVWLPDNPFYAEFLQAKATAKTSMELWYLWATPNSVVFVDEAQRYFRPRPAGSPVPLYIQLLEYHRHFGIHFLFLAQRERFLHSNVRALAGQHIHLTDGWRGRHRFEWPEVKDSESKSEKALAAHSDYKLPKHVFSFYTSAVSHLAVKHKTPLFYKVAIAAAMSLPVIGYAAYSVWPSTSKKPEAQKTLPIAGAPSAASGVSATSAAMDSAIEKFTPTIPGRPETAPAYDALRQVVTMPVISACLETKKRCLCYTQQGTRIGDMSEESCRQYLAQGTQFDPYRRPSDNALNHPASGFSASGAVMGSPVNLQGSGVPVAAQDIERMGGEFVGK